MAAPTYKRTATRVKGKKNLMFIWNSRLAAAPSSRRIAPHDTDQDQSLYLAAVRGTILLPARGVAVHFSVKTAKGRRVGASEKSKRGGRAG